MTMYFSPPQDQVLSFPHTDCEAGESIAVIYRNDNSFVKPMTFDVPPKLDVLELRVGKNVYTAAQAAEMMRSEDGLPTLQPMQELALVLKNSTADKVPGTVTFKAKVIAVDVFSNAARVVREVKAFG